MEYSTNGTLFEIRATDTIHINDNGLLFLSTARVHHQFHDHWCLDIFGDRRSLVVLVCENKPFISKRFAANKHAKSK